MGLAKQWKEKSMHGQITRNQDGIDWEKGRHS